MKRVLSLDLETKDPYIKKFGSGAPFEDSKILCICACEYYNGEYKAHLDIDRWQLADLLNRADVVVGSNIQYDLHYIHCKLQSKLRKETEIVDILITERLLDTVTKRVNLDSLAKKYLDENKRDEELLAYALDNGIIKPMENLERIYAKEPMRVIKYCYSDTNQALRIYLKQLETVEEEGLMESYETENAIQKVVSAMRQQGVPFDLEYSKTLEKEMDLELTRLAEIVTGAFGTTKLGTDVGKRTIASYCDRKGIKYSLTSKTIKPKLDKTFFAKYSGDENLALVEDYKTLIKLKQDFVIKLQQMCVRGKIYPSINAMRGDEGGAITGRFSMSRPNLQQIPSRNALWAKKIRSQFRAPEGSVWIKADYSQQEVRLLFEFAAQIDDSALDMVRKYKEDPTTDAYNIVVDMFKSKGFDISRSVSKTLVLGSIYCMGAKKMAMQLNCREEEAKDLKNKFNNLFPSVRNFQRSVIDSVEGQVLFSKNGRVSVETLGGRKIYLEVIRTEQELNGRGVKVGYTEQVDRAYKAVNYKIQGSGADIMKRAMVSLYEKHNLCPTLTVHDELGILATEKDRSTVQEILREVMENTYSTAIPMTVEIETGASWGEVE